MVTGTYHTFYDVSRDWSQILVPIFFTAGWLLGPFVAVRVAKANRKPSDRLFIFVWLTGWIALGGFGLGNVWYQHFHCIRELKSGNFLVVEGPISFFRPEVGKASEEFTVGGETFEYYSASLGGGGMRYSSGQLRVGEYARVTYDHDRMILRLEVWQRDQ